MGIYEHHNIKIPKITNRNIRRYSDKKYKSNKLGYSAYKKHAIAIKQGKASPLRSKYSTQHLIGSGY